MGRRPYARPPKNVEPYYFAICQRFFYGKQTTTEIAEWVNVQLVEKGYRPTFTRQQVYPVLFEGVDRKHVRFTPPDEDELALQVADLTRVPTTNVRVVNTAGSTYESHDLATVASDMMFDMMTMQAAKKERAAKKGKRSGAKRKGQTVHFGLGAGHMTKLVAEQLAQRLRSEKPPGVGGILLHALTSGFMPQSPELAPVSFFTYFDDSLIDVSYEGLFTEPMVYGRDFARVRENPGVRPVFDRREEIEIIVTSLATADDPMGLLNQFEKWFNVPRQDRVGDVQYRPFSEHGPIEPEDDRPRAVTLFELEDYVRMTQEEGKYLVLCSGVTQDGQTRTKALLPLLTQPKLRVWSHLCLDVPTATEVVGQLRERRE